MENMNVFSTDTRQPGKVIKDLLIKKNGYIFIPFADRGELKKGSFVAVKEVDYADKIEALEILTEAKPEDRMLFELDNDGKDFTTVLRDEDEETGEVYVLARDRECESVFFNELLPYAKNQLREYQHTILIHKDGNALYLGSGTDLFIQMLNDISAGNQVTINSRKLMGVHDLLELRYCAHYTTFSNLKDLLHLTHDFNFALVTLTNSKDTLIISGEWIDFGSIANSKEVFELMQMNANYKLAVPQNVYWTL